MTLRTRLAVASALILVVAVGAVGVVLSQSARLALIDPIDQRLTRIAENFVSSDHLPPVFEQPSFGNGPRGGSARPEGRDTAVLRFVDGELDGSFASGFEGGLDPLPSVTPSDADELAPGTWRLVDLSSASGSVEFRGVKIVVSPELDSGIASDSTQVLYVFAQPLTAAEEAVEQLRLTVLMVALLAVAIGGALTWWTVRRSFRPVDETIAIVEQIGDGDLGLRVPEPLHPSELNSLGRSINAMLGDIERANEAESAARTALTQFVADASHELRTPIAAISGHSELIDSGRLDADSASRSMDRIRAEALRMQRLVDDLLILASHDSGHRRMHRLVNLSDIVADAVEDGQAIDAARTYATSIEPEIRVVGDEAHLQQVIANLLANIRAHTPAGTTASIVVTLSGHHALVRVSDNGPGVPETQQPRMFERFFRSDMSSPQRGGAGLGLAIVAAIVDEHNGTIEVRTVAGQTCFELRLPIDAEGSD